MADIAAIFHWPRSDMLATPTLELLDWRERAVERFRAMYAAKSQH